MNASRIRDILSQFNISPSKALGQNFLIDENIARGIVDLLELEPQDCVVEVGPGTGSLTEFVAPLCRKLILVEFDARLAAYQRTRWADTPHVTVYHADAAGWDTRCLYAEQPVKFLGNLPYSSGGAILTNFLYNAGPCCRAVVMLQKEFAERMLAVPGDKAYGLLSLRTQMNWEGKAVRSVPPTAFCPRPKVDSTVLLLTPRDERSLPVFDRALMDELMRRCFACRRKQMHKQLPPTPPWQIIASALGLPLTARPEELSLLQWTELTRAYDPNPLADIPQRDSELLDVVDEQDHPLRRATRREIHEQGLFHRAVHILVFNKHGDLLLQKRSVLKDTHPGLWDSSAAGHVDSGETYEQAAHRELAEELGISDPIPLSPIAKLPPSPATGQEHIMLYTAHYNSKIHFPAAEISAVKAFPSSLIRAWMLRRPSDFSPSFRLVE